MDPTSAPAAPPAAPPATQPTIQPRRRRRVLVGLLAVLLALLGGAAALLAQASGDAERSTGDYSILPAPESGADAGGAADSADSAGAVAEAPTTARSALATAPEPPAVVRTGTVALTSRDLGRTRTDVRRVLDAHAGEITDSETTAGEDGISSLRLTLRVPATEFAATMAALEETATLLDSTSNSEDVSAEVVDVEARVRAQRRSVERIEALLARASTVEQVVAVESQLATRQADLDALLSRQAWLADRTAMSTITLDVSERGTPIPDDDTDGFSAGLAAGWDSFTDGSRAVLTGLGFALPWAVLLAALSAAVWALRRRRPAPATP